MGRCGSVLIVLLLGVMTVTSGATDARAAQPKPDRDGTVWLCRPGLAHDPCTASLKTTEINANGTKQIVNYNPASRPGIDCFYVYPAISNQFTPNTNLHIDPQETAIAELEASPFSQDCRVFAPMYREVTADYLSTRTARQSEIAYKSVLSAWNDYLAHYNDGRGLVRIGQSEGAQELDPLIATQIDHNASIRDRMVSSILTGWNLTIGSNGSGPFSKIGPCTSASQTGCVVAYNAFSQPPPPDTYFGLPKPSVIGGVAQHEQCTNPAALAGGSGTLESLYRTQLPTQEVIGGVIDGIIGSVLPPTSTPWTEFADQYSAECVDSNGATVLMVTPMNNAPTLTTFPDAQWGLHVDDPNLALGNLVGLVQSEAMAYIDAHS